MEQEKLVSLLDAGLALSKLPAPFSEENVLPATDRDRLIAALRRCA